MTKKEIWRAIPGFTGCYASNYGRVWNKRRKNSQPTYGTRFNRGGYKHIHWANDYGERCQYQVHQLIAMTYPDCVSNPGGKTQLDHIDGNAENNAVWNLRWVTPSENAANLVRLKRFSTPSVFNRGRDKCEGYDVKMEDGRELSFRTMSEASKYLRCSAVTFSRIMNGSQKDNGFGIVSIKKTKEYNDRLFNL